MSAQTAGEVILGRLARELTASIGEEERPHLSREQEILSLRCLVLAIELRDIAVTEEVRANVWAAQAALQRSMGWYHQLPLDLTHGLIEGQTSDPLSLLIANLNHHNSAIREYVVETGWIARRLLTPAGLADRLRENIASTLLYWEHSVVLLRGVCASDDEMWLLLDGYEAAEYQEQYLSRVELVRGRHPHMTSHLDRLEAEVLRGIVEAAARLERSTQSSLAL